MFRPKIECQIFLINFKRKIRTIRISYIDVDTIQLSYWRLMICPVCWKRNCWTLKPALKLMCHRDLVSSRVFGHHTDWLVRWYKYTDTWWKVFWMSIMPCEGTMIASQWSAEILSLSRWRQSTTSKKHVATIMFGYLESNMLQEMGKIPNIIVILLAATM